MAFAPQLVSVSKEQQTRADGPAVRQRAHAGGPGRGHGKQPRMGSDECVDRRRRASSPGLKWAMASARISELERVDLPAWWRACKPAMGRRERGRTVEWR